METAIATPMVLTEAGDKRRATLWAAPGRTIFARPRGFTENGLVLAVFSPARPDFGFPPTSQNGNQH
jgi:hypothetical protein